MQREFGAREVIREAGAEGTHNTVSRPGPAVDTVGKDAPARRLHAGHCARQVERRGDQQRAAGRHVAGDALCIPARIARVPDDVDASGRYAGPSPVVRHPIHVTRAFGMRLVASDRP